MKKKFNSMWRVGLALVMALSLGLVMAAPVSATVGTPTVTNAPETVGTAASYDVTFTTTVALWAGVGNTITITFPTDTYVPAGTSSYDGKVTVNTITCPDGTVTGAGQAVTIKVPLDISAPNTVTVVIDKAAGVKNPTAIKADWKLTVKTSAEPTAVPSATYSTLAPESPTLRVDITAPTDLFVSVGQTFTVTAVVINEGPITATAATAVKATIAITGTGSATATAPLTKDVAATLPVGGSATVTWTVTCNGAGTVDITVTPSGSYIGGAIPPATHIVSDTINLTQELPAALEVTDVTTTPVSPVKVGDEVTVTARVKNTGVAKAKDVELTINPGTKAALTSPDIGKATKTKTDFAGLAEIAAEGTVDVTWQLKCTAVGDTTITVTPAGKDANTKLAIPGDKLKSKTATVVQTEAAVLLVTISTPKTSTQFFIGAEFPVTATVKNTGASTAKGVELLLTIDTAFAELKADEVNPKLIGYLAPGATSTKTWILVCTGPGDVVITVDPLGKDVLTDLDILPGSLIDDSVTVHQVGMPYGIHLVPGWNLISLPLIPGDSNIDKVLAGAEEGVEVNKVAYYTGGPAGDWLYYAPPAPADLFQMKDGKGYWIDVSGTGGMLTYTGVKLALPGQLPPTYEVVVGWNLIGFTTDALGTGATATATVGVDPFAITEITVTDGGSGYTSPTVVITDTTGTGATATAIVVDGVITEIVVTYGGSGYTSPTVVITDALKTAKQYLGPAVEPTVSAMYSYTPGFGYKAVLADYPLTPGYGYWLAVNALGKIYP